MNMKHFTIYLAALCGLGLLVALSPSPGIVRIFGVLYVIGWAVFLYAAGRGNTRGRQ